MKLFKWFWYIVDSIPTSPGLLKSGMWRVRYNDGEYTVPLTKDVCKDYAEIYGGTVIWVRYNDPFFIDKLKEDEENE